MRNIVAEKLTDTPIAKKEIELVERKGLGHPDTVADGVAESISRALCKYYLEEFGAILHHNTDKVQVSGGETQPDFLGGKIKRPIHILLSGQATNIAGNKKIPVDEIAIKSAKNYLKKILPNLDTEKGVQIESRINPGSADLRDVFKRKGMPSANDTSLGVGSAPMTPLEAAVLNTEIFLNCKKYKKKRPEIGQDIKVMGYREKNSMKITIAAATLCHLIKDVDHYIEIKENVSEDVKKFLSKQTDMNLQIFLNTADSPENGKSGCYLTVTGTSAEMGDSGAVGRGNKVNGLITPYRPMTMEAAAGKNPVSHVGKIYNILAFKCAQRIVAEIGNIDEARVRLLSQIGKSIDQPLIASIELCSPRFDQVETKAKKIVDEELANIPEITQQILRSEFRIF